MIQKIISAQGKLSSLFKESIKSGDIVTVSVIKQLDTGKWAVSIKGKVFPAVSSLTLFPGEKLKAQIIKTQTGINLKIVEDIPGPIRQLLSRYGIPHNPVSETIVRSLLLSSSRITADNFQKLRRALERMNREDPKTARALALVLGKDMDISGNGIDALLHLLSYGEDRGERQKKRKRDAEEKPSEEALKQIKDSVEKVGAGENLLQAFNHIKSHAQNWIVIPYSHLLGGVEYSGTIRVLYDPVLKKTQKIVLVVNTEDGERFSFLIHPEGESIGIRLFHGAVQNLKNASKLIDEFNIKLQNKGAKIDDIIYNEADFDGFSPLSEVLPYKTVDTLT